MPVLTRAGCNQGTCHGNGEGKGGFKLSLRGEDAARDYQTIARDGGGRRVNRAVPGASLFLEKPLGVVPHGGGQRFAAGSEEYRVLAGWLADGARFDAETAPELVRLEVLPKEKVLVQPARSQRLTVHARFSDGSVRDVTRLSYYVPSDPAVTVSPDGLATASGSADTAVIVRYAEGLESARLTFVPARKEFRWPSTAPGNWIDALNFPRLKKLRLAPSALTTDAEFLRRAYLDTLGLLPTPEETRAFVAECGAEENGGMGEWGNGRVGERENGRAARGAPSPILPLTHSPIPEPSKRPAFRTRASLVEKLLQRPEFNDLWTMRWGDMLRLEERSLDAKGVIAYRDWIRESMAAKKPLDRFVRELLTATGSTYTNPPANFYRRSRTPIELSETTAQVFMGARMGCAKCHNHPFERWTQNDYYALAAFFARVDRKIENLTRRDRFDTHELNGEEIISVAKEGEVTHPRTGSVVAPCLPGTRPDDGGQKPSASARASGVLDRRVMIAEWLTSPQNPYFARAMVNRIWFSLIGRGLVDPVDDLRDSNPPSNPELLDALARDFVAHGFDLRHTVREIMNSRTYQLSSEPNATNGGDERFFSRGIAQRLPAEVLLDTICQVTGVPETFKNFPDGTRAVQVPAMRDKSAFLRVFGQPPHETVCECERSGETTLGQSFALISGAALNAKIQRPDNRIGKLLQAGKSNEEIVRELYVAGLCREPSAKELAQAIAYVARQQERRAALEDLLWAILNSKEFLLRR